MSSVDEFKYLPYNAAQAGYSGPLPAVTRIDRGPVSALVWGRIPGWCSCTAAGRTPIPGTP